MGFLVSDVLRDEIGVDLLEIHQQLYQKGGCPHDPQKLHSALRYLISGDFAKVGLGMKSMVVELEVDLEKTMRELVVQGKYDWVDPNLDYLDLRKNLRGVQKAVAELNCFGRVMKREEINIRLKNMNLRDIGLYEILTLGMRRPELQMEFPIIAPVSFWEGPNGIRFGIKLGSEKEHWRTLECPQLHQDFPAHYWFAGIRK